MKEILREQYPFKKNPPQPLPVPEGPCPPPGTPEGPGDSGGPGA